MNLRPQDLTIDQIGKLSAHPDEPIFLAEETLRRIESSRQWLDQKMATDSRPVYGVNTGFGYLCDRQIAHADLEQLQVNLIRSHACGTGAEVPEEVVRLMLLLKIKSLSYGHSGVQTATVLRLVDMYNHQVLPVIYTRGSLGASGDLAPLAHLSLPLLGEGEVRFKGEKMPAAAALANLGWEPVQLEAKEGLALLNGTQFMLAYAVHVLLRAERAVAQADAVAALSLDAFDGSLEPFHPLLHEIRPHNGQIATARNLRQLLEEAPFTQHSKPYVQDPYSFRCIPQVHGATRDALAYCRKVFETEVNSVSDNPNIFPEEGLILSGGNFHGQPLALALDFLAIAVAEIGSISERRIYQLLSGQRGLPLFLIPNPGLDSGLMIPQYTAASLVNHSKTLCAPASTDTIPSSNNQEDHVSMGGTAAVKSLEVVKNTEEILGIELMCAAQALEFRLPRQTAPRLAPWLHAFRLRVAPLHNDRILYPDMHAAADFIRTELVSHYSGQAAHNEPAL
jgi:histidine ammonia-lyase